MPEVILADLLVRFTSDLLFLCLNEIGRFLFYEPRFIAYGSSLFLLNTLSVGCFNGVISAFVRAILITEGISIVFFKFDYLSINAEPDYYLASVWYRGVLVFILP